MVRKILVGTENGIHELGNGGGVRLSGSEITALAKGDSGWWAVLDGHEIWRAGDDGEWVHGPDLPDLRANCILPAAAGLFVGTSESHVYSLLGDALEPVASFDETPGRDSWHTPWGGPPDVRSMSEGGDGALYANVHVGGIPRSDDAGAAWTPTIEVGTDVHQVHCDAESGLVLAASARGLGVSDDGGRSWRYDTGGLHARYMRAVTVAGDTLLATASTGPYTSHGAVYRRPVGSAVDFERCSVGLPERFSGNVDTYCIDASSDDACIGTSEGSVYVSSDQGATWSLAAEGLPSVRAVVVA